MCQVFRLFIITVFFTSSALASGTNAALSGDFLYVPTGDAASIEIVDTATDRIVSRLEGFSSVHGLGSSPEGRFLVVGSLDERSVDAAVPKPKNVPADDHAAHHAQNTQGSTYQPAGISVVSIVDREKGEVVRRIDVPGSVHHVVTSPGGRYAVVTHPNEASVTVVGLENFEVATSISTGENPNYAVFTRDGRRLLISVSGEDRVILVDTASWKIVGAVPVGAAPEHLVLSGDDRSVFVNNVADGSVSVISLATLEVTQTYRLGETLHGIDITDAGDALIVSVRGGDRVARIDLESGAITNRDLPPAPYHVTAAPGTGKVYVSSAEESVLTVLSQSDLTIIDRIPTSGIGHQMVVVPAVSGSAGGRR